MDDAIEIGCVVCRLEFQIVSPAEIHHLEGKTKEGAHLRSIPLCPHHHRLGLRNDQVVSRHPHKQEFERRYGTEEYLLECAQRMVSATRLAKAGL